MLNTARAPVIVALLSLFALALTGCGPAAATAQARPSFSPPPVGRGTGGAGSLTVSVTKPVAVGGHVDTAVSCTTNNRVYTASADGALVAGYRVAFTVRIAPYHGAGTYPAAVVSLALDGPTGTVASGTVPAPATITTTGGSFTLDTTTTGDGHSLKASLEWACDRA